MLKVETIRYSVARAYENPVPDFSSIGQFIIQFIAETTLLVAIFYIGLRLILRKKY